MTKKEEKDLFPPSLPSFLWLGTATADAGFEYPIDFLLLPV